MRIAGQFGSRVALISAFAVAILLIGWLFAYQPVTRNLVAAESVCTYCHLEREYTPGVRLSFSKPHPATPKEGEEQARCVDCHLPEGWWNATYTYTHIASVTDLFGHFRDRDAERAGEWIPPAAARAYRVRDRLFEYDSATCRTCHVESEIKPKRKRGQRAHAKALKNKDTCVECHDNLAHRYVELRETAFQKPEKAGR